MNTYGKIIKTNVVEFENLPNQYNGVENVITGYRLRVDLHRKDGFFLIEKPVLKEGERYIHLLPSDLNIEKEVFEQRVESIPQPTAQELYDNLITEGKQVFEEYENMLARAATPYSILGNIPQTLKDLTQELLDVKAEIVAGLKYYLDNNMIDKLQSFNYYDDRAEDLKTRIENFK